ncbi:SDR family NAD(P)-dependent oxidoreductase [Oxalobacteraceae bacterium OM1]|nr:SDR family NAD(P)-dependent oxidoreductase [Oxalobacteraceae bacterium OM1]
MRVKDRVAVITGAGSGIGRAIAVSLARRGCHLALADINRLGIEQTAELARALGVRVSLHDLDVASREMVRALPAAVQAQHGRIDILVNNAGVALGGTFEQVSEADFDWLMEINFHGVVRMTRAFLPYLHAGDDARIVNLSSLYGLVSPAGQAAYSASKFAVRGFSNALRHELEGSGVGVTVVHPGGVATAIAKNARVPDGVPEEEVLRRKALADKLLRMPPEKAGEIIVRGIERRQARVIVGMDAKIVSIIERIAPVRYWALLKRGVEQ